MIVMDRTWIVIGCERSDILATSVKVFEFNAGFAVLMMAMGSPIR